MVRASLLASESLTVQVVQPLAIAARGPLDPDVAAQILATPAWKQAVSSLVDADAVVKDDGRFVYMATLMPREVVPAFVASVAALSPVTTRAARDFADLILALPDRPQPIPGASP
jgi:hypothetical protein